MKSIIRKKCVITGEKLSVLLKLGKFPLANDLKIKSNTEVDTYELTLCYSNKSNIVQINNIVNPEILFKKYLWVTGTSKKINTYKSIFYKKTNAILGKDKKNKKILEIASNDGTFLETFNKNNKYEVLGVDPAKNLIPIAKSKGIKTINKFYNINSAKFIKNKYGKFDFIYARNVIAHVKDINAFVKSFKINLKKNGIGCFEFHYLDSILKGLQYDSIYHEHIYYFSLKSISILLKKYNLFLFDCFKSPISGGAIVVYFSSEKRSKTVNLIKQLKYESETGINTKYYLKKFAHDCLNHKNIFKNKILKKINNKKIVGYGASARGATLLNFLEIQKKHISKIIDINNLKHNKYIPGLNIKVVDANYLNKSKPDYILLLSWNFKNEIITYLKANIKFQCTVILPLPNKFKLLKIK